MRFQDCLEFSNDHLSAKKKDVFYSPFLRYDFEDILTVALAFDSSSSDDSNDEDDLDLLLVDAMFPETSKPDYIRLKLDDLSEIQCETMFRLVSLFFFLFFFGYGHDSLSMNCK